MGDVSIFVFKKTFASEFSGRREKKSVGESLTFPLGLTISMFGENHKRTEKQDKTPFGQT